jgi:hypothetical protein
MTIGRSARTDDDAGDRRGDDTHWWKAYQLHSTVALPAKEHGKLLPLDAAFQPSADERFQPTETEIHRAASKALGSPRQPSAPVEPSSD